MHRPCPCTRTASSDATLRLKALQDLREEWRDHVTRARSSSLQLRLVDELFSSPYISIPRARELLDVAYSSAQRSVDGLVAAGILKQIGDATYDRVYVAEEILTIAMQALRPN